MTKVELRTPAARRRRARDDRGAVLVEAAIVLPILFMIVFGILEIGSALKSYSGAANAVRAGGRMASVAGNDADADQAILERMAQEATGIPDGRDRVHRDLARQRHRRAAAGGLPADRPRHRRTPPRRASATAAPTPSAPATSTTGRPPRAAPSTWPPGRLANPPEYYFGCTGPLDPLWSNKVDCQWPAKNRKTTITPRGSAPPAGQTGLPDYVGVYIRARARLRHGRPRRQPHHHGRLGLPARAAGLLGDRLMRRFSTDAPTDAPIAAPPCSSSPSSSRCCSSSPSAPPRWAWPGSATTGSRAPCPPPPASPRAAATWPRPTAACCSRSGPRCPQEQLNRLDRVVIFKPTNANGGVPAGCIKPVGSTSQAGVTGPCNTYAGTTVRGTHPHRPRHRRRLLAPDHPQRPAGRPARLHRRVGPHLLRQQDRHLLRRHDHHQGQHLPHPAGHRRLSRRSTT